MLCTNFNKKIQLWLNFMQAKSFLLYNIDDSIAKIRDKPYTYV